MSRMTSKTAFTRCVVSDLPLVFTFAQQTTAALNSTQFGQKVGRCSTSSSPRTLGQPGRWLVHDSQGSVVAYVSADGRYLLQGDLIDLDNQVNLSEQSRTNARRELMATVADDQTILFSPEDVKYSVTVFTDVDCTYCRACTARLTSTWHLASRCVTCCTRATDRLHVRGIRPKMSGVQRSQWR